MEINMELEDIEKELEKLLVAIRSLRKREKIKKIEEDKILKILESQNKMEAAQDTPRIKIFPDGRMDAINASIYVGLSNKTLAMLRCHGKGPKFIKRGKIFYFKDDLDKWLLEDKPSLTVEEERYKNSRKEE